MKQKLINKFLTGLFMVMPVAANAFDFELNDIYYNIISEEDRTVEITYNNENVLDGDYSGDMQFPGSVIYNGLLYRVTAVGPRAFRFCNKLESVKLPASITEIGDYAFSNCYELQEVEFPVSLTTINACAFENCAKLTEVNFSDNLYYIGLQAFSNCTLLSSVNVGNSLGRIGNQAFEYCTSLENIDLPASLEFIGSKPFYYCTNLQNINIAEGGTYYKSIDGVVYSNYPYRVFCCPIGKTSVTIDAGVREVMTSAFYGCYNLNNVSFPEGLQVINDDAFFGCEQLTEVVLPESVSQIRDGAFRSCTGLQRVVLPEGLSVVPDACFWDCYSLEEINFPAALTYIGKNSFSYCRKLEKVETGDQVTVIENLAFSGCSGIREVRLGGALEELGYWSFSSCSNIEKIECYAEFPPQTLLDPFENVTYEEAVLYVRPESLEAYQTTSPWNKFIDIRGELEYSGVERIGGLNDGVITLYDLSGRKVYQGESFNKEILPAGIYILQTSGKATKIVVE